jgi:hypothetical protein
MKNAGAHNRDHPDEALAFTLTARNLQCGHAVWGKVISSEVSNFVNRLWMAMVCPGLACVVGIVFKANSKRTSAWFSIE